MRSADDVLRALEAGPLDHLSKVKPEESDIVKFETLWSDPADGWAIASRAAALAMHAAGINVQLHEWKPISDNINNEVMRQVGHLLRPEIRGKVTAQMLAGNLVDWVNEDWGFHIFSTTLADPQSMRDIVMQPLLRMRRPLTLYTTFERLEVGRELGSELNKLDGMWVPCTANLDVLKRAGVTNCEMIPFPFFDEDPHLQIEPTKGRSKFYWIGRWEPRKAPDRLVKAFLFAFRPGEAELTMKTSPIAWQAEWKTLGGVAKEALALSAVRKNGWNENNWQEYIHVVTGRLSNEEMVKLHADHHIYVSTSRGEGTDLPALQSKISSRRLVTTDSGGPRDFIGEGDILIPQTGSVPADPMYPWGEGAAYADHDFGAIVAALQTARADTNTSTDWPKGRFHFKQVGQQFKEWIERIWKK